MTMAVYKWHKPVNVYLDSIWMYSLYFKRREGDLVCSSVLIPVLAVAFFNQRWNQMAQFVFVITLVLFLKLGSSMCIILS